MIKKYLLLRQFRHLNLSKIHEILLTVSKVVMKNLIKKKIWLTAILKNHFLLKTLILVKSNLKFKKFKILKILILWTLYINL
jgi:hypothetical protein